MASTQMGYMPPTQKKKKKEKEIDYSDPRNIDFTKVDTSQRDTIQKEETSENNVIKLPKTIAEREKFLKNTDRAGSKVGIMEAEQQEVERQRRLQQAQVQALPIGQLTPEQMGRQIGGGEGVFGATSVIGGGFKGAAGGAATGAGIGALLGPAAPVSIPVAAGVGAVAGFIGGALTKISGNQRQNIKEAYVVGNTARSNIDKIINLANQGKISAAQATDLYNEELSNLYAAYSNLKKDTDTNLDRFMGDGLDELAKVESYIRLVPMKEGMLKMALIQPNPNAALPEMDYYVPEVME